MESSDDPVKANQERPPVRGGSLEEEEERLREKLMKRRRTDEQSGSTTTDPAAVTSSHDSPPSNGKAKPSSSNGDHRSNDMEAKKQRRSPPSPSSSRSNDRERNPSSRRDERGRSRGGGGGGGRGDLDRRVEDHHRNRYPHPSHDRRRYPPPPVPPQYRYPPQDDRWRGGPPPSGRWERGGPPGYGQYHDDQQRRGPPYPPPYRGGGRGGGPPRRGSGDRGDYDDYYHYPEDIGYGGYRPPMDDVRRGRSRSRSRSYSTDSRRSMSSDSRSRSRSRSKGRRRTGDRDGGSSSRHEQRKSRRGGSGGGSTSSRSSSRRDRRSRSRSTSSASASSASSGSSASSSSYNRKDVPEEVDSPFSKDQRTVFVSQLIMRTQEKDIRRYFRKKVGCLVKEVILLRDKRTGYHKGCAYVQFGRIEDVNKAVSVSGQPPDFQRFPILVKPSEAEKNYTVAASSSVVTSAMMGAPPVASTKPLISANGKLIEAQKVYVGSLDPSVMEEHIFALFSQFGQLEKVTLQMDPTTKTSRGFAFLAYRHPEEANLAIQSMSNQVLAGRAIKTGWASQTSTVPDVEIVTSEELPSDAAERIRKAMVVLAKMSGSNDATIAATAERALEAAMMGGANSATPSAITTSTLPTVDDGGAHLGSENHVDTVVPAAVESPPTVKLIGGEEHPTKNVLVHNMFDKDQESGDDWPVEIKEDFEEECSKFGTITSIIVMSKEVGGKIYASFETVEAATLCANNLAGRWFDKRQLRVDFMRDDQMRTVA